MLQTKYSTYCTQLHFQLVVVVVDVIALEKAETRVVFRSDRLFEGLAIARDVLGQFVDDGLDVWRRWNDVRRC